MQDRDDFVGTGIVLFLAALFVTGCATEIGTTHYLGVYDPQQQVTQDLYRVEITGRAPWYSKTEFATGWVPAGIADLVTENIETGNKDVEVKGQVNPTGEANGEAKANAKEAPVVVASRKFFEVGPLGVSTAPQNYRFVALMANDPDYFFQKVGLLSTMGKDPDGGDAHSRGRLMLKVGEEALTIKQELARLAEDKKTLEATPETPAKPAEGGSGDDDAAPVAGTDGGQPQ